MQPLYLLLLFVTVANPATNQRPPASKTIKFSQIDSATAMNSYRANYKKAPMATIKNLFGIKAGAAHTGPDNMLASVTFTRQDLLVRPNAYLKFFKGTIPDFSSVLPNPKDFDGFRIHVGIDMSTGKPLMACLLTFGKVIGGATKRPAATKPKKDQKRTEDHDGFVQDNLKLGIYKIEGGFFQFDDFPLLLEPALKKGKRIPFTHLSCNPACDGDALL
ncbi:hypothetical protein [Spirosoma foliorum]|uniref:Uncharacterized protein n=1 Tax=Spirosoma foliorum TaxID=2710596 RepID=A0A7G5GRK5_9BACT|nr:hypothetical protein [Spirosoma foliorum]QMW01497.1 hypothetical protein H3H32_26575 [Spirosoma foliorum]